MTKQVEHPNLTVVGFANILFLSFLSLPLPCGNCQTQTFLRGHEKNKRVIHRLLFFYAFFANNLGESCKNHIMFNLIYTYSSILETYTLPLEQTHHSSSILCKWAKCHDYTIRSVNCVNHQQYLFHTTSNPFSLNI